jgi:glycosyltransferase involved in cell wall biosynthesis
MSRRHVLVFAYHFPPIGGGGVPRTLAFVKHLGDFGWNVTVVTGPAVAGSDLGSAQADVMVDETLLGQIPESVEIVRVAGPEPGRASRRRERAERWLGLRLARPWSKWWIEAATDMASRVKSVDVAYASMSPYESAWVGRDVGASLGIPWVADLRDPWALDEMQVFPTAMHRALERRRMRALLRTAARVVMNTPEAAREFSDAFPELDGRLTSITNGYEPADFESPAPEIDPALFRIVFTGGAWNLHIGRRHRRQRIVRRALGAGIKDVDLLPRSTMFLLEATERLLSRRPELRGFITVEIAGSGSPEDTLEFESLGGVSHGYLTHTESVRLIRSADMLFLGMQDLGDAQRANSVPGKTYEYIASGRPIIAAVPPGDARDLLSTVSNAIVCRPTDVAAMERAIERLVDRKREGRAAPTRSDVPSGYDRVSLTRALASVLDSALDSALDGASSHARPEGVSAAASTAPAVRQRS